MTENTRANDILKLAPFLVPFTSRAKIFAVSCLSIDFLILLVFLCTCNSQRKWKKGDLLNFWFFYFPSGILLLGILFSFYYDTDCCWVSLLNSSYQSQLGAARDRGLHHIAYARNRLRVRRDRILEDAFNQLNVLAEEELRGPVIFFIFVFNSSKLYIYYFESLSKRLAAFT